MEESIPILLIERKEEKYKFTCSEYTNASEVFFAIAALIKCLERDDKIPKNESLELIKKYLYDPQYDEPEEKETNAEETNEQIQ